MTSPLPALPILLPSLTLTYFLLLLNSPGKNSLFRALFGLENRELVAGRILKTGKKPEESIYGFKLYLEQITSALENFLIYFLF